MRVERRGLVKIIVVPIPSVRRYQVPRIYIVPLPSLSLSLCRAATRVSSVEKLLWGGNSQEFPKLSTTRYRSVVTVKRAGSFKFSRAEHGSGIVAVVIAAIYRLRPSLPPWSGCCWWFALQKSELRNRGEA